MILDDLQILITADSRGVEQVLKKTTQTVLGTVNNINSQEIDWTSIFTQSVSPAIIAGVASMFAFAISNAVQFQAAMNTAGTAAGDTPDQIAQVGSAALSLAGSTAQAPQDLANSMLSLSAVLPNVSDQSEVTAAMAQLAGSGFGSLSDITQAAIPIMQEFGVTTADGAITVLTDLMHGAQASKESIAEFANSFSPYGTAFADAGVTLDNLNGLMSTFAGEIEAVGKTNAEAVFSSLATSANNPAGPMELLGSSIGDVRKSLTTDGGIDAITKASNQMQILGPSAQIVATAFGFSSQQVLAFQLDAKNLTQVIADTKTAGENTQTIAQAFIQADNDLRDFQNDWETLKTNLIPIGDLLLKGMGDLAKNISTYVIPAVGTIANDINNGEISKALGDSIGAGLAATGGAVVNFYKNLFQQATAGSGANGVGVSSDDIQNLVTELFDPEGFDPSKIIPINSDITTALSAGVNQQAGGTAEQMMNDIATHDLSQLGLGSTEIANIEKTNPSQSMLQTLIDALQMKGTAPTTNNTAQSIQSTFHINLPQGPMSEYSANDIANALYKAFNGIGG